MNSRKMGFVASFVFVSQILGNTVVTDWNAVASASIVATGGKSPAAAGVWFSYVSLAVYDAVNSITGEYQPFYYRVAGPASASVDAAAVAAAHRVLVNYFPAQQAALDNQYTMSLAAI